MPKYELASWLLKATSALVTSGTMEQLSRRRNVGSATRDPPVVTTV